MNRASLLLYRSRLNIESNDALRRGMVQFLMINIISFDHYFALHYTTQHGIVSYYIGGQHGKVVEGEQCNNKLVII